MLRWLLTLGPLLLITLLITTAASADEFDQCFEEGKKLLGQAKYDDACAAFDRCEEIGGATVKTRYQLGRCNEERGKFARAHKAFSDAARLAKAEGDDKRADVAKKRASELAGKVARIKVLVAPAAAEIAGLKVRIGDDVVAQGDWNKPVAVDPGDHVVTAKAPGYQRLTRRVSGVTSGELSEVTIPPLAEGGDDDDDDAGAPAGAGGYVSDGGDGADSGSSDPDGDGMVMNNKALFWVGFGLTIAGGLGIAGGAILVGIEGEAKFDNVGAIVAGGIAVAVGIPFLIIGGKKVPADEAWLIEPLISPTGGGVRVTF